MSFLGVLKSIGHVIGVGAVAVTPFDPEIEAIPGFGPAIVAVLGAIAGVEKMVPQSGAGAAKKPIVTSIVNLSNPGLDPTKLSKAIDDIVAAMNALKVAFTSIGP
jgi:hypothetical protein